MLLDSITLVNDNEKKFEQRLMRIFLVKQKPYSCNREDVIKNVSFKNQSLFFRGASKKPPLKCKRDTRAESHDMKQC